MKNAAQGYLVAKIQSISVSDPASPFFLNYAALT
jgi:hypothetical protein